MRRFRLGMAAIVVLALTACEAGESGTAASTSLPPTALSSVAAATTTTATEAPPGTSSSTTTTLPPASTTTVVVTTTTGPDVDAPALTVTDPAAKAVVTERAYRFRGTTEPGASVTAAGLYPAEVAADGTWSIVLILNPGGNVATFVAEDAAGNQTEVRHPVSLHECAAEPAVAIPAGATDLTTTMGDVDGDGVADVASVYRSGGAWYVGVEFDYGWSTAVDITPQTELWSEPASVYRVVDVGDPVILVIHGGTAIGIAAAPYGFHECGLEALSDVDGGSMLRLFYGVSNANPQRFVCEPTGFAQVTLYRPESGDGFILDWFQASYLPDRRGFEVWAHPPDALGVGLPADELDILWSETLAQFPQC